jgi:hypothetical protein
MSLAAHAAGCTVHAVCARHTCTSLAAELQRIQGHITRQHLCLQRLWIVPYHTLTYTYVDLTHMCLTPAALFACCCCCCCCRYKGVRPSRPPPDPIEMARLARQAEGFEAKFEADPADLQVTCQLKNSCMLAMHAAEQPATCYPNTQLTAEFECSQTPAEGQQQGCSRSS